MAYRDKYNLEPLKITAALRTPVVSDRFLPLDGILLYQAHRWQCGVQVASIPGEYSGNMKIATLPLEIEHPGRRNWFYRCSWAQWSHDVEGKDHWNKRFDSAYANLVNFGKRRGKVIIEQGKFKAYHMPIFYRVSEWVLWYCVGDKTDIEAHLSTLTHIGKKGAQGWGRVAEWKIERIEKDWSVWKDGKLMRGIPVEDIGESESDIYKFTMGNYGIRPSYWKSNNQKRLVLPDGT